MSRTYKQLIGNFIKNVFSYAVPVAALQFIVQPIIARVLGPEENGLFLTLIAVVYFITSVASSTLAQVRLLKNEDYLEAGEEGDFNPILMGCVCLSSLIFGVAVWYYTRPQDVMSYALTIAVGCLYLVHDYMSVDYKIKLDYTKILLSNLVLCLGYLVGTVVFCGLVQRWQIVFICAYGFSLVYDSINTTCLRKDYRFTSLFKGTVSKYFLLMCAGCLNYLVSYGDRILLLPLTNGETISVYTSAGIVGKLLMLLTTPLSTFLLSYIVRIDKLNFKNLFGVGAIAVGCVCGLYAGCVLVSYPLLHILYPMWAEESLIYVPYTAATSLAILLVSVLNVIVIRFCHSKYQIIINASYLVIYLVVSFTLLFYFGVMGYCLGNMIAAVFRLLLVLVILLIHKSQWICGKAEIVSKTES